MRLLQNKGKVLWSTFKWVGLTRRLAEQAADCGVVFMFMKADKGQICWGVSRQV